MQQSQDLAFTPGYIGTKTVRACPCTKLDHMTDYGAMSCSGEDYEKYKDVKGYRVTYPDGYVSWSPKEVFEASYRKYDDIVWCADGSDRKLTFSDALFFIKQGKKAARTGWNGKNMFACLSPGSSNPLKQDDWFSPAIRDYVKDGKELHVRPSFMLKTAQEDVAYWVPSCSDILAEDWYVF